MGRGCRGWAASRGLQHPDRLGGALSGMCQGFKGLFDLRSGLIAQVRLLLHAAGDDVVHPGIQLQRGGGQLELALGRGAGEHFIEHTTQRIQIGPVVHHHARFPEFGRGIFRRAHGGEGVILPVAGIHQLGQPEIR